MDGIFTMSGSGDLEWIGELAFTELVKSGKGLLGLAAEIHLRSL